MARPPQTVDATLNLDVCSQQVKEKTMDRSQTGIPSETAREGAEPGTAPQAGRRAAMRTLSAMGMAALAALGLGSPPAITAAKKAKKGQRHGIAAEKRAGTTTVTQVLGPVYGVNPGQFNGGLATCPSGSTAVSGGFTQNSNECFAVTLSRVDAQTYAISVRCPPESIGALVTPEVTCIAFA